jgi:predicted enzyme related to lactoylglutathione lyase
MKKIFILLAVIAYFVIGAYSVTRTKSSALTAANAQTVAEKSTASDFKLVTNQLETMMKFYHEAFGTDWQANQTGYRGQVLNANVQLAVIKNRKPHRVTVTLEVAEFDGLIERILDAGGNLQARGSGKAKSYSVNDPDGNLIVLTLKKTQ